MNTESNPQGLATEDMPVLFQEAFDNPEYEAEVEYIRKDRVEYAELHPSEVPALRDKVRFKIVALSPDRHQVWQCDTAKGLYCVGETTEFQAAKSVVDILASNCPERTDIMDEGQLRKYILENHITSTQFFESLDDLLCALRVEDYERDQYYSCWLWAILKTVSGWALWATDDINSAVCFKGLHETEAAAEEAAGKLSTRELIEFNEWLLDEAYADWVAYDYMGDEAEAEAKEYYRARLYLGDAIRSLKPPEGE